jgi:gamma-D-glutamyl-L-lysine dipeptidyl-peptidase
MKHGLIALAAVSCKAEASHKSEQINQLLFGDYYTILEEATDWYKITSAYDNYEGWIPKNHHTPITNQEFKKLQTHLPLVSLDMLGVLKESRRNNLVNITIGSSLYFPEKRSIKINGFTFKYNGKVASQKKTSLLDYAFLYLNTPYLWGGRTPFGIDCSGFVQMTHKLSGIKLPRDSYQQAELGQKVINLSSAKKGDLCFFGDQDRITHVGILVNRKSIIHASGKVKIESIDDKGILDETGNYTHFLVTIKRL